MSGGWVCPGGGYVWGWVCPRGDWYPDMGPGRAVDTHPPLAMGPGIPGDTVGKRVVRILLECFLVVVFGFFWWLINQFIH